MLIYYLYVFMYISYVTGTKYSSCVKLGKKSMEFHKFDQSMDSNICDINLINERNCEVTIQDILRQGPVAILFYTSSSCWACVSDYLVIFNTLGSSYNDKVKVFTTGVSLRNLYIRAIEYPYLSFYKLVDDDLKVGEYTLVDNEPTMWVLNTKCQVLNFRWGLAKDSIENPYFREVVNSIGFQIRKQ